VQSRHAPEAPRCRLMTDCVEKVGVAGDAKS
jgi:hypothetical protein